MSNFRYGKRSRRKLYGGVHTTGVSHNAAALAESALRYSTVDFSITDGFRTTEEQQALFAAGHTELDGIVGKSDHQSGLAIDILPYVIKDGKRVDMYRIERGDVAVIWLEVYRAFMRAGMKHRLILEFGLGYNIGGGRDWPHISIKGRIPGDYSGLLEDKLHGMTPK